MEREEGCRCRRQASGVLNKALCLPTPPPLAAGSLAAGVRGGAESALPPFLAVPRRLQEKVMYKKKEGPWEGLYA